MKEEYLDLLKRVLTHSLWPENFSYVKKKPKGSLRSFFRNLFLSLLEKRGFALVRKNAIQSVDPFNEGRGWPLFAETMVGFKRLDNIKYCIEEILRNDIPGDFIETGVWRGGATIYMKAILNAYDIRNRVVWVADSFEGLPKPNPEKYPEDKGDQHYLWDELKVSLETVKGNFEKYKLLDDNVKFLKGWFKDTLPDAPIEKLSLLRVDGDIYESTMDALNSLYPKLSIGGFVIIDDFLNQSCVNAVMDYRKQYDITDEIIKIDWTGVFWKKTK